MRQDVIVLNRKIGTADKLLRNVSCPLTIICLGFVPIPGTPLSSCDHLEIDFNVGMFVEHRDAEMKKWDMVYLLYGLIREGDLYD